MGKWRARSMLVCLVAALAGCKASPAAQSVSAMLAQLSAAGSINASVLVARGGTILVQQGYGFSNLENQTPNSPQTRFRIGSNTKQFTAAGILLLAERGKLSLQDPICNWVASCPAAWAPITLQELLTHSSGIFNYTDFDDFPSVIGTAVTVEALIDRFKPTPLDFKPGTQWEYSNSGYVLLGSVIEQVSGSSYADFLTQQIFLPLGMTSTGYDSNSPPPATHATGYLTPTQKPVFLDMSEFYAAGALYSTVGDLYLWDQALLNGKILSQASVAAMFTPQIACPQGGCAMPSDVGYGYGQFISIRTGKLYVYHWGRIDGFVSSNGFYPDTGAIVIVLSNLETTDAFGIGTRLADLAETGQ